ncbi:hypothetical protein JCM33374_g5345 [Metschnikowia sp. JCM 33374]|nr:hypothetical protein JCM33374_g5345 [Metschnikowia sp. JCM 33374]
MDLNYPDFLNERASQSPSVAQGPNHQKDTKQSPPTSQNVAQEDSANDSFGFRGPHSSVFRNPDFENILQSKLAMLDQQQDTISPLQNTLGNAMPTGVSGFGPPFNYANFNSPQFTFNDAPPLDSFNLPRELQGGIGNISSRRPSYAAESFTRSVPSYALGGVGNPPPSTSNKHSLATFAAANNYSKTFNHASGYDQLTDSFGNFNLNSNSNFSDFQARRPSQLAEFQSPMPHQQGYYGGQFAGLPPSQMAQFVPFGGPTQNPPPSSMDSSNSAATSSNYAGSQQFSTGNTNYNYPMKLDNKLMLKNQHILSSAELKGLYSSVSRYYQDDDISQDIVRKLKTLLNNDSVSKLISFIKNLNNLNIHHKMLCLVINKNGKLDLLSYPNNSNIYLQNGDMVIVDGDRGKDLVMVLEPLVSLDMAILFNFLKKIEHLKSLTIMDSHGSSSVKNNHWSGTHSTAIDASAIVNGHSNEDNEFVLNLPTKQVLRFATPKEIQKLSGKFLEEKKAFVTCFNKIKELGLSNDLTLINVEYQFDFKKLIFYYFAGFKRIDFRDLIKELFKIYKTRIWLCAVLPYDKPELYTKNKDKVIDENILSGRIPKEYDLSTDQVMNFSLESFNHIPAPTYFHSRNMFNLIDNLEEDVKGGFYGFNKGTSASSAPEARPRSYSIQPSFNPFGETGKKL